MFRTRERKARDPVRLGYSGEVVGSEFQSGISCTSHPETILKEMPGFTSTGLVLPTATTCFLEILPFQQIAVTSILCYKCSTPSCFNTGTQTSPVPGPSSESRKSCTGFTDRVSSSVFQTPAGRENSQQCIGCGEW